MTLLSTQSSLSHYGSGERRVAGAIGEFATHLLPWRLGENCATSRASDRTLCTTLELLRVSSLRTTESAQLSSQASSLTLILREQSVAPSPFPSLAASRASDGLSASRRRHLTPEASAKREERSGDVASCRFCALFVRQSRL